VRTKEKGEVLMRHEVIPVVGDFHKPETWGEVLEKVAWVITTVPDFEGTPMTGNRALLEAVAISSEASGIRKTFIFTSGVLVYPHSLEVRDENCPILPDNPFFDLLRSFEKEVLAHHTVRGIVLRPGAVYGGSSGNGNNLLRFFTNGDKDKLSINHVLKSQRWNWVHVVDLADAYVRAARQSHAVKGEAFNIVADSTPTYEEIFIAAARMAGFKGTVEYTDEVGKDLLSQVGMKTVLFTHNKARDLLGWTPQHIGVMEELDIYYHTWKGSQKTSPLLTPTWL